MRSRTIILLILGLVFLVSAIFFRGFKIKPEAVGSLIGIGVMVVTYFVQRILSVTSDKK